MSKRAAVEYEWQVELRQRAKKFDYRVQRKVLPALVERFDSNDDAGGRNCQAVLVGDAGLRATPKGEGRGSGRYYFGAWKALGDVL